jgi:hypothetical protein
MTRLSNVLVDEGCGVGLVTPDAALFDELVEPSDVALAGFDGTVRHSTRADVCGQLANLKA